MNSISCITCSFNMECKHWNILLLSLSLHEYQIISSFLFEMHSWHVWNICWEIIWKYYLHSSKSLVAYKCLRRNFCDVILLQASKKKKINIIWRKLHSIVKNSLFSSFLWRCANKDSFFIISWFIFTKAFHCRPWFFKGNGWLKILLLIYLSCVLFHFKYPFTLKSGF